MFKILFVLLHRFRKETRALSSAGSEHLPYKQRVGGSNPSAPTPIPFQFNIMKHGRLAQLVQSICLTSRGSAVRIRQRPLLVLHDTSKQTHTKGRLAQLVQSICLTSRGSAVRIRQRPLREIAILSNLFFITLLCLPNAPPQHGGTPIFGHQVYLYLYLCLLRWPLTHLICISSTRQAIHSRPVFQISMLQNSWPHIHRNCFITKGCMQLAAYSLLPFYNYQKKQDFSCTATSYNLPKST